MQNKARPLSQRRKRREGAAFFCLRGINPVRGCGELVQVDHEHGHIRGGNAGNAAGGGQGARTLGGQLLPGLQAQAGNLLVGGILGEQGLFHLPGLADLGLLLGQVALVHQGNFRLLAYFRGLLGQFRQQFREGVHGNPRAAQQLARGHRGGRHGLPVPG